MNQHSSIVLVTATCLILAIFAAGARADDGVWTPEHAKQWAAAHPWLVGSNFIPSTAINELEMWQADTFDPATIDRELGWAEGLGFNGMRVFLHNIPWEEDSAGFLARIDQFLTIADKHRITITFVLFDSCWDPFPKAGKQRAPQQGLHNSGWVQCPGAEVLKDPARREKMEGYVKGVVGHFKADQRINLWDVYNEPDNTNDSSYGRDNLKTELPARGKIEWTLGLMAKAFTWAREAGASQPLSSAPWQGDWSSEDKLSPTAKFQFEHSDVITFHMYSNPAETLRRIEMLRRYNRPILCSEYMARPVGSTFKAVLPVLKEQHVGAYNWGFVAGKSNTIYPWDSWQHPYASEPKVWFHDIFRAGGTPFDASETAFIKSQTGN